mmetsp:Transcript_74016/g.217192  ORF Transcript_74016/g.217192 Transcript_74016/m.217192 type:complete len:229 (+) Transcript_74016:2-688(+)
MRRAAVKSGPPAARTVARWGASTATLTRAAFAGPAFVRRRTSRTAARLTPSAAPSFARRISSCGRAPKASSATVQRVLRRTSTRAATPCRVFPTRRVSCRASTTTALTASALTLERLTSMYRNGPCEEAKTIATSIRANTSRQSWARTATSTASTCLAGCGRLTPTGHTALSTRVVRWTDMCLFGLCAQWTNKAIFSFTRSCLLKVRGSLPAEHTKATTKRTSGLPPS